MSPPASNSAASASSASLCFHAKLPTQLAFVPYPWLSSVGLALARNTWCMAVYGSNYIKLHEVRETVGGSPSKLSETVRNSMNWLAQAHWNQSTSHNFTGSGGRLCTSKVGRLCTSEVGRLWFCHCISVTWFFLLLYFLYITTQLITVWFFSSHLCVGFLFLGLHSAPSPPSLSSVVPPLTQLHPSSLTQRTQLISSHNLQNSSHTTHLSQLNSHNSSHSTHATSWGQTPHIECAAPTRHHPLHIKRWKASYFST